MWVCGYSVNLKLPGNPSLYYCVCSCSHSDCWVGRAYASGMDPSWVRSPRDLKRGSCNSPASHTAIKGICSIWLACTRIGLFWQWSVVVPLKTCYFWHYTPSALLTHCLYLQIYLGIQALVSPFVHVAVSLPDACVFRAINCLPCVPLSPWIQCSFIFSA